MKKLIDIRNIVNRSREGWSDTKIALEYQMSRNTVRKYRKRYQEARDKLIYRGDDSDFDAVVEILEADPKYDSSNRRPYKYSKELDYFLDELLDKEEAMIEKGHKRYPKTKIHQQVLDAGFEIGYTTISKKVDEKRLARIDISPWSSREMLTK